MRKCFQNICFWIIKNPDSRLNGGVKILDQDCLKTQLKILSCSSGWLKNVFFPSTNGSTSVFTQLSIFSTFRVGCSFSADKPLFTCANSYVSFAFFSGTTNALATAAWFVKDPLTILLDGCSTCSRTDFSTLLFRKNSSLQLKYLNYCTKCDWSIFYNK